MTSVAEPQSHSPSVGSQNASAPPSATPQDKSKPFELYVFALLLRAFSTPFLFDELGLKDYIMCAVLAERLTHLTLMRAW